MGHNSLIRKMFKSCLKLFQKLKERCFLYYLCIIQEKQIFQFKKMKVMFSSTHFYTKDIKLNAYNNQYFQSKRISKEYYAVFPKFSAGTKQSKLLRYELKRIHNFASTHTVKVFVSDEGDKFGLSIMFHLNHLMEIFIKSESSKKIEQFILDKEWLSIIFIGAYFRYEFSTLWVQFWQNTSKSNWRGNINFEA